MNAMIAKINANIAATSAALRERRDAGAVSIEYLAIALVVVVVLGIAIAAASGAGDTLTEQFREAVEGIFGGE